MVISSAVTVAPAHARVRERLAELRRTAVSAMAEHPDISSEAARFVAATLQGMSQQARDGASTGDLLDIARFATAALDARGIGPQNEDEPPRSDSGERVDRHGSTSGDGGI
jgi:hypothetical protein